jgi:ankyrin repeat protein
MKKLFVTILVLTAALSASAQTIDIFDLVKNGTSGQVQLAILNGTDVDAVDLSGMTTLMVAALSNQDPVVITSLLMAGVDIEARDTQGRTALMLAAMSTQNPEVVVTLLNAGADGKKKADGGKTAFDYAIDNENLNGTKALRMLSDALH